MRETPSEGSSGMTAVVSDRIEITNEASPGPSTGPVDAAGIARRYDPADTGGPPDAEFLRSCAWDVAERKPAEAYQPTTHHVGLAMVTPTRGIAHWRLLDQWIERAARQHGDDWHGCRMVLRLYDVSYIQFDGLNAHRIQDHDLPSTCGHIYFDLPRCGTWQLAEVGFLLRNGEFLPAARSQTVPFASVEMSPRYDQRALLVDDRWNVEEIGNVWDQEQILVDRRAPRLRQPLRIAVFTFPASRHDAGESPGKFISELATGLCEHGHEVHVFLPDSRGAGPCEPHSGVNYETLDVDPQGTPSAVARDFARAADRRLRELPPFDLIHMHEWMTGGGTYGEDLPTVLSLSSIEPTRRNGTPPNSLSEDIERAEREILGRVPCILAPDWLREKIVAEYALDEARVKPFAMEGRLPNQWECPLDEGEVKAGIGVGPLDRLLLFVGPLEYAAGVDLILEAFPVLLQRYPNLRVAFAGAGESHGYLQHRAGQLGVDYAVRLLGHVDTSFVSRLLRASEALLLPSRYRVPFDDAVVDLARRAGRPTITTHGGPAHLVRHEETGVVTYDNPGSIVWAMDRILGDPAHARRMGENGRCCDGFVLNWNEVSRHYLELCAACFPQLTQTRM
ncbi:MAG: glycosyltransferase [Pirellulales bacterium]|nr:glycosyltransferase [Pirellulales bacterium]